MTEPFLNPTIKVEHAAATNSISTEKNFEEINSTDNEKLPDIPEHVFVEYEKSKPLNMDQNDLKTEMNDIQTLYRYLEQNLEKKGYEEALTNPDSSYLDEQLTYINNDLRLVIAKVKTFYNGHIREINFHIETRKRNGMIETVDELLARKDIVEDELKTVQTIEQEVVNRTGLCANLFLSYKRGFNNGLAAITYNTVLGNKR
jgi:hypothetical protein